MTRRVAFFDFDGTLTRCDSLLPFLRMVVGTPWFIAKLGVLSPVFAAYATKLLRNDVAKEIVLTSFLRGMPLDELKLLGQVFASEMLPRMERPVGMKRLQWHQEQGHLCVLVSASLDLYLAPWAAQVGLDHWLTSSLQIDSEGRVTGGLEGGNCFGNKKVENIKRWLRDNDYIAQYAYGDSKGDLPMLRFAQEGFLLDGDQFLKVSPE